VTEIAIRGRPFFCRTFFCFTCPAQTPPPAQFRTITIRAKEGTNLWL
jgi:hypothetical protein